MELGPEEKHAVRTQVMQLIMDGQSDMDIAHKLRLSKDSITSMVKNLLRQYGCTNRTQLVVKYLCDRVRAGQPCPFCDVKR